MTKCSKCGHDNNVRGKYCGICGAPIKKGKKGHELHAYTKTFKALTPKTKNKWSF